MAETSHEIRRQIDATRKRLGTSIAALEQKVDPRRVVDEHPLTLVAVAFGTGILLATTGATSRAAREVREQVRGGAHAVNDRAGTVLDGAVGAVLSAVTAAITSRLSETLNRSLDGVTENPRRSPDKARAA